MIDIIKSWFQVREVKYERNAPLNNTQSLHWAKYRGTFRMPWNRGKYIDFTKILSPLEKQLIEQEYKSGKHQIDMPVHIDYYNGSEKCGAIIGICACGAWHDGDRFGLNIK